MKSRIKSKLKKQKTEKNPNKTVIKQNQSTKDSWIFVDKTRDETKAINLSVANMTLILIVMHLVNHEFLFFKHFVDFHFTRFSTKKSYLFWPTFCFYDSFVTLSICSFPFSILRQDFLFVAVYFSYFHFLWDSFFGKKKNLGWIRV